MNNPDRLKINKIVGYIQHKEAFCFDTADVLEDMESVLAHFGVNEELSAEEFLLLQDELHQLAERFEFSEVVRQTLRNEFPLFHEPQPSFL